MRAIGAIPGAIVGAVLGYIGAFVIGYPIVVALDGPDRDGGIAMGVAMTLGPAMAVITALIFLLLILRLTRPKEPQTVRPSARAPGVRRLKRQIIGVSFPAQTAPHSSGSTVNWRG